MRTVDPVRYNEKRQGILYAARRCFARDGLRNASMSSICAEAHMSPGHLYHYFKSKDAILGGVMQMVLAEISSDYDRTMETSDALATLIYQAMMDRVQEDVGRHLLVIDMLADAYRDPVVADILQDFSARMQALMIDFLREGQANNRIDPTLDPGATAAVIIALVDGVKMMALRQPGVDRVRAIEMLRVLLVRFLTPERTNQPHGDLTARLDSCALALVS